MILEEQNIEKEYKNLEGESLNTKSYTKDGLARRMPQTRLLENESLSSSRKVRFSDQEFAAGTPISNIKYNHPRFQKNNPFYPFHDQLNYRLAKYFVKSKTTKSNVNKFLFEPLIVPFTKKLFYQNMDK